jgi:transmembrane sensor
MQDTDYIKLVLKHLDSEASPAEQAALHQWLEADPRHRLEYQALERIWRESGRALNKHSFNVEAALEKVENRLDIRTPIPVPVPAPTQSPARSQPQAPQLQAPQPQSPVPELRRSIVPRSFSPVPFASLGNPWRRTLAAASVLLVFGAAGWWFFSRSPMNLIRAETASLKVVLPDGSQVQLRKGATLSYSRAFAEGKERVVDLSGEAFFMPVHNPSRPFHIRTEHAILQDIGTSFVVREDATTDELTVITGKVKFAEKADPSNSLILAEGQKAVLSGSRFTTSGAAARNVIAWTNGILDFKDEPLQDVVADITDCYQTPVVLDPHLSDKARAARVNARFAHQPLKDVLEEIRLTTGLSTRKEKDTFVFFQE